MSRRKRRRLAESQPRYAPLQPARRFRGGLSPPSSFQRTRPQPQFQIYLRKRAPALAPAVSASRTVRSHLMRTVLRDTKRRPTPAHLRRRDSPHLLARGDRWIRSIAEPWPTIPSDQELTQALTCGRRHIRREVLFALRSLNGSGGRGKPKSKQRC